MPHYYLIAQNDLFVIALAITLSLVIVYALGVEAGRRKEKNSRTRLPLEDQI